MKIISIGVILIFNLFVVSFAQETFIKSYTENNFAVNPWMIEDGPEGPLVCGFKLILAKVDSRGIIDGYVNIQSVEFSDKDFVIAPNPVSETFNINIKNEEVVNIEILNGQGEIVLKIEMLESSQIPIDSRNFPPGLFYVRTYTQSNESTIQKFIKH